MFGLVQAQNRQTVGDPRLEYLGDCGSMRRERVGGHELKVLVLIAYLCCFTNLTMAQGQKQANLTEQRACSNQADKTFKVDFPKPWNGWDYSFTNHYDSKLSICYIWIHGLKSENKSISVSDVVYNAFEGRTYASYLWINSEGKKYWEVSPMECSVKPRGQEEILCKSSDEFDQLVDRYFGIGR
jgi:hypothetical protein